MNHPTSAFDQDEQQILACEVSDEALEATAAAANAPCAIFTLAACTGLSACPAIKR